MNEFRHIEHDERKIIINNIKILLGNNFKYEWILDFPHIEKTSSLIFFKFTNKSQLLNNQKSKFVTEKINELDKYNYGDISNIKKPGLGRYIVINIKTIDDYLEEKRILLETYNKNIKIINEKINILENQNIF